MIVKRSELIKIIKEETAAVLESTSTTKTDKLKADHKEKLKKLQARLEFAKEEKDEKKIAELEKQIKHHLEQIKNYEEDPTDGARS